MKEHIKDQMSDIPGSTFESYEQQNPNA